MNFPKKYADTVARLRVPSAFLLVAAIVWFAHPDRGSLLWGVPVSGLGLWLRGWAAGHLAKNQKLVRTGPYQWTRNPLYIGTLLVAAGLVIASRSPGLGVLFAAVFLLIYLPVIQNEQQHLAKLFPDFEEFAATVPMLVPRPPRELHPGHFSWALYRKNEEYQALLGFLLGFAFLIWRT